MATCARLGWRARYVGRFGGDDLGVVSRDSLTADGVDISASQTIPGATSQFAIILVDGRTGERTVLWDRHPALNMEPADVPCDVVTSGRLLIVDCHQTAAAAQAARFARAAGIPTIIDVEKVRPGIGELLQNIDAIIAAEEFPGALTGHEDLGKSLRRMAREFGASLVCVTLGKQGSLAWCHGREIRTPGYPIDCVDSTGAGDCFRGAFAAACLNMPDGDVEDALMYANAVAALNCRALGSRGALPTADEVDRLMLTRPIASKLVTPLRAGGHM
jgi:sugar/nucleoside kinase (ribokinase family)